MKLGNNRKSYMTICQAFNQRNEKYFWYSHGKVTMGRIYLVNGKVLMCGSEKVEKLMVYGVT